MRELSKIVQIEASSSQLKSPEVISRVYPLIAHISTMFINPSAKLIALVAISLIVVLVSSSVECYPTASVSLFSHANKLEEKSDDAAEQSFQQFIHSKPDSTIIGELKPNSSELELMMLRNKIASTILSMQEMEKSTHGRDSLGGASSGGAECFIEVTRVERVAGKCHKVNNGLPICQSDNYMAINTDCS